MKINLMQKIVNFVPNFQFLRLNSLAYDYTSKTHVSEQKVACFQVFETSLRENFQHAQVDIVKCPGNELFPMRKRTSLCACFRYK